MRQKTKLIIIAILSLAVILAAWKFFFANNNISFEFAEVTRGKVVQEVSATGQLQKGREINLSFKTTGEIEEIYVEVAEEVEIDTPLAKLKTDDIEIQLQEARASLDLARAKLAKLFAGAAVEEIALAKTQLVNSNTAFENAKQNLADVKANTEQDLTSAYEDSLNILDDAYLKIYNAFNTTDGIERTYFYYNDQESLRVQDGRLKIDAIMAKTRALIHNIEDSSETEEINTALSEMNKGLDTVYEELVVIRDNCEKSFYRTTVSDADKDSLDDEKSSIISARTRVVDANQAISSVIISSQKNINTAQAELSKAQGNFQEAEKSLEKILAKPVKEDIELHQAEIKKAESQADLLLNRIKEAALRSPAVGQLIKINKKNGEVAAVGESVFVLLPSKPFQVKVDIYEEEISHVQVSDLVRIEIVAFPEREFNGRVAAIKPAEKIVDEVVYYEVSIDFEGEISGLRPGLTADVVIETDSRDNALYLPGQSVLKKDKKFFVKVLDGKEVMEKEIEVGLLGTNDRIEVLAGLNEGEKVIFP